MTNPTPRKKPTQKRALATVKAIVDATAQLLVTDGYHNLSTNKIAEAAGVSIGSLYQYFPNKECVVAAVVKEFADRQFAILAEGLANAHDADIETSIRQLLASLFEAKRREPELSRALFEEIPAVGQVDILREWTRGACEIVRLALQMRASEVRPRNLDLAAYILVTSCHGVTQTTVVDRPELFESQEFADETAQLVLRYLMPDENRLR